MMRKIIIICVFSGIISCSYAQLAKFYSINIANDSKNIQTYDLAFVLCEYEKYAMWLVESYDETWYYFISEGKYKVNDDTLILTDFYTHHQMKYKFDNPYVYPVITFPFMTGKVFIDYGQRDSAKCEIIKVPQSAKEISDFKKENNQEYTLEKGLYKFFKWKIELADDNKFEIHLNVDLYYTRNSDSSLDLLLFTGTWKRDGNILLLWDTNFEHQFYGFIREDGIELPGFSFFKEPVFKKE